MLFHTDRVHRFDTSVSRICWTFCSPTVTHDWFLVVLSKSWRVPHVVQEMLTLSGTPDFTPIGAFMISPIHCTVYTFITYVVGMMEDTIFNIYYIFIPQGRLFRYNIVRCGLQLYTITTSLLDASLAHCYISYTWSHPIYTPVPAIRSDDALVASYGITWPI